MIIEMLLKGEAVQVTVKMIGKEYREGIEAVPLPGDLQGLEHSGGTKEILARLARMAEFIEERKEEDDELKMMGLKCRHEHVKGIGCEECGMTLD